MLVQIASKDEFSRLLDGLGKDVVDAAIHFRLYADLVAAIPEYERELNQSRAFWQLTFLAHWKVALGCLIRVFDQQKESLCLVNLIDTITESPILATLRGIGAPASGTETLKADRTSVSTDDALVKRLVALRGNVLAHRSAADTLNGGVLEARFGLSLADAQTLVTRAVGILNAYSSAHRGSSWSTQIVGHDDYLKVLRSLRAEHDACEARIQQEMRDAGIDPHDL